VANECHFRRFAVLFGKPLTARRKGALTTVKGTTWQKACGLAVVMDFGGGLLSVAVPMTAVRLGAEAEWVGVVGAAALAGYTLFCFLSQPLTDRWGRRTSMLVGSVSVTVLAGALTVAAALRSLWLLCVANLLIGVCYAFFWPATQAMAGVGVEPKQLLSALRFYNLAWSGGRMVGTGLGGVLFEWHPLAPFALATFASASVALATMLLSLPNIRVSPTPSDDPEPLLPPIVTAAQLGNFVRSFTVTEAVVLLPKLGKDWGFTEGQISGVLFLIFAGHIIAFLTAPRLVGQVNWHWVVGTKIAISALAFLVGIVTHRWLSSAVLLTMGYVAGLMTVLSIYLSIATQGRSVKGSARHEAGVGAGGAVGPVLGGFALRLYAAPLAFALPAVLALVTFTFWDWRHLRWEKLTLRR